MDFDMAPSGPFDLSRTRQYFGGWLSPGSEPEAIVMTFPVEGWRGSAAVVMRQRSADAGVDGTVHAQDGDERVAWSQALATLSLDCDGAGWGSLAQTGSNLEALQRAYAYLRPVLFYSPYEAAAAFTIGHRISIKQGRAIREAMAKEYGDAIRVGEETVHAFPRPQVLRGLTAIPGVSPGKIPRLHAIAEAALGGWLDRAALRGMPEPSALEKLRSLPGIGPFFAQGILYRGAGLADAVTDDEMTKNAYQRAFNLPTLPDHSAVLKLAEPWRPYRMWATVLLHVSLRRGEG